MRCIVCFFLVIFFFCNAKAQYVQDTVEVYTSLKITNDPIRANWRPTLQYEGNLWNLKFYNKKGIIQESICFEDKALTIRKGAYLLYKNGRIIQQGNYEKGHKHGWWTYYSDEDGQIIKKILYRYDKSVEEN